MRIERSADRASASTMRQAMTASNTSPAVVTADPPVPRPNESPCVVQSFSDFQFTNFTSPTFPYAPPASCPGPWAKVVFSADFNVTAGRQYDRTASVWIGGTNVYFGTTAEPSSTVSPSWHVERDVTDLSAVLRNPSTGLVVLGNLVNSTYTGIISASATLAFYPANAQHPAPPVPDAVYPLSGGPQGDNQYISSPSQPLTATYTLPTNVRAAYLDVFLQSQGGDEFWYTCFPNDLAAALNNCGNTAFREGDVAIDGQPAGVAPVYPWIYTGGIDPYLWRPIPGVETLNFKPYRVNLTPFAALLSNGQPHTITVNVFNNGNYFAANGALLVYVDPNVKQITGGIISNSTPAQPSVSLINNVKIDSQGNGTGAVTIKASHPVSIDGYINTADGRVETQVHQEISFVNAQQVNITGNGAVYDQNIKQNTQITSDTTTTSAHGNRSWVHADKTWPLGLIYDYTANPDGSATQLTTVNQGKIENRMAHVAGDGKPFSSQVSNTVTSTDTLTFFAAGGYAPSNGSSSQTYTAHTSSGYCWNKTVRSKNNQLTSQTGGPCS